MQAATPYPAQLSVDYPDGSRNRLTVAFRLILAIPILLVAAATRAGVLFVATLLMLVFRHKYPRWWYDWNLNIIRFFNRVVAYLLLLRDEYPSTDEAQHVHVELPDPQSGAAVSQWLPLVKWFLIIPQIVVLVLLGIASIVVTIFAWLVIIITGRHPRGLHGFVVGVLRWGLRVEAYAFALVTDEYPPFRLAP
jgi:hypothetical protein